MIMSVDEKNVKNPEKKYFNFFLSISVQTLVTTKHKQHR